MDRRACGARARSAVAGEEEGGAVTLTTEELIFLFKAMTRAVDRPARGTGAPVNVTGQGTGEVPEGPRARSGFTGRLENKGGETMGESDATGNEGECRRRETGPLNEEAKQEAVKTAAECAHLRSDPVHWCHD